MISQGLEQKLTQKLSKLQIQMIKLLELSVQDLEQRVRVEMEENPALDEKEMTPEESRDVSLDSIREDDSDNIRSYNLSVSNWGKDARQEYNTFSVRESFTQGLLQQLGYRNLTETQADIARFLVGSLDQDGYLRRPIDAIVDDLSFHAGIETTEEEVLQMLSVVQDLDPAGIGARNVQECLLLQLRAANQTEDVINAERILRLAFDDFSSRHFSKVLSKLNMSESELKAAIKTISRLNPAPGGQTEDAFVEQSQQIVPDFVLTDNDGVLGFELTRGNVPELRLSRKYEDMLRSASGKSEREQKETATFIKGKMDSAKWFIDALKQRQNTLRKTMQAILDYQQDFFLTGDEKEIKPLILETIAQNTGFDISTISRVVGSKYIETPYGIFPLKFFFSEKMVDQDGAEISTRKIKSALQDIIDAEDKNKPLTDEQLVEQLSAQGFNIARRTVAKYRDQLGIPLARFRKEF